MRSLPSRSCRHCGAEQKPGHCFHFFLSGQDRSHLVDSLLESRMEKREGDMASSLSSPAVPSPAHCSPAQPLGPNPLSTRGLAKTGSCTPQMSCVPDRAPRPTHTVRGCHPPCKWHAAKEDRGNGKQLLEVLFKSSASNQVRHSSTTNLPFQLSPLHCDHPAVWIFASVRGRRHAGCCPAPFVLRKSRLKSALSTVAPGRPAARCAPGGRARSAPFMAL